MKPIIAVDPGQSGAIAWIDRDCNVSTENMPPTYTDLVDFMRWLRLEVGMCVAVVENVGGYVSGNSGPAAVKFGRHCGNIETTLYSLGIPLKFVAPSVWMKKLGTFPKDKKDRKNAIKQMMSARYPHIKVTLKNADALGMLTVEVENG